MGKGMLHVKRFTAVFALFMAVTLAVGMGSFDVNAAAKKPKKITVKTTSKTIDIKGTATVSVKSVKPAGASKAVSFKSSNKKVAKVNAKGIVTGKKTGTTTITVTSKKNKKVKATVKIKVKNLKPTSLTLSKSSLTMEPNSSKTLTATVKPNGVYCPVKWSSSNNAVVSVSSKGKLTAKGVGTATIKCITKEKTSKKKVITKTCNVTVAKAFTGKYIVNAAYAKSKVGNGNTVFVDCRGTDGAKSGTVKGAIATTWGELSTCSSTYGKSGDVNWGKIPAASDFAGRLGKLGLSKNKEIILFADANKGWGEDGRVLWQLVAAGYTNVKMVNGGFDGLKAAGVATQKGASTPKATTVSVDKIDNTHVMDTETLHSNYSQYVIIDTRADAEYNGAVLYGEAKGGHLKDAKHIRFTDFFYSDGILKSNDDISKMLSSKGIAKDAKIVTYCTAGIRSGYAQLIFEMCGYTNTYNYDQSYYRWCKAYPNEVTK